jgi:hypothetical protein
MTPLVVRLALLLDPRWVEREAMAEAFSVAREAICAAWETWLMEGEP